MQLGGLQKFKKMHTLSRLFIHCQIKEGLYCLRHVVSFAYFSLARFMFNGSLQSLPYIITCEIIIFLTADGVSLVITSLVVICEFQLF